VASLDEALKHVGPYPGRVLAVGISGDGRHLVELYMLTGRSAASRSRRLREEPVGSGRVIVEARDGALADGEYLYYFAMGSAGSTLVVGNGDHVDALIAGHQDVTAAAAALNHEFDAIRTPRIAAVTQLGGDEPKITAVSVTAIDADRRSLVSIHQVPELSPGEAIWLRTYAGDDVDVRAWTGSPQRVDLGDVHELPSLCARAVPPPYLVALAIRQTPLPFGRPMVEVLNA
jgi:IMP cyclohydrolase